MSQRTYTSADLAKAFQADERKPPEPVSQTKTVTEKRWAWLDTGKSKLIYIHPAGNTKRESLGIFRSDYERLVRVTLTYKVPR